MYYSKKNDVSDLFQTILVPVKINCVFATKREGIITKIAKTKTNLLKLLSHDQLNLEFLSKNRFSKKNNVKCDLRKRYIFKRNICSENSVFFLKYQ